MHGLFLISTHSASVGPAQHLVMSVTESTSASLIVNPVKNPGERATSKGPHRPRAKKSLGQHFLVDRRVLGRIIEAADLSPDDVVLEVGPGRGFLTRALAERAGRVVAVEMDENLADRLAEKFRDGLGVDVVPADAREVDIDTLVAPETPYKVVANLPYYAASPIIRRFLEAAHKPTLMVVTVQREVAQEMVARPGKMRLLSVATQLYSNPKVVCYVQPRAFRPAPKVTSAVVRIDVLSQPAVALDSTEGFFRLVKAGFSAPRKQIHNCLRHGLDISPEETRAMLLGAGIDPTRRPQTLSLPEWGRLYDAFRGTTDRAEEQASRAVP